MAVFPIEPIQPLGLVNRTVERLIGHVDMPICYSQASGRAVLRSTGLSIPHIPLPIDTDTYFPRDRAAARARYGLSEGDFIITLMAEKQQEHTWKTFAVMMQKLTRSYRNIRLLPWILHGSETARFDLNDYLFKQGLEECIVVPKNITAASDDDIAHLYTAMDVLVATGAPEAAALPMLHARACGTPVLVKQHSPHAEFSGHEIEIIPTHAQTDEIDANVLEQHIDRLYQDASLRATVSAAGRQAMQNHRPQQIMPLWDTALALLQPTVTASSIVVPTPSTAPQGPSPTPSATENFDWLAPYEQALGRRFETLKETVLRSIRTNTRERIIVEIACTSPADAPPSAHATALFGDALSRYGGHLHTIHPDLEHVAACKRLTSLFSDSITYHVADSLEFMRNWPATASDRRIDVLYIDGADFPTTDAPHANVVKTAAQLRCVRELNNALPYLNAKSFVLIDDANMEYGGQAALAKYRLAELGWVCILNRDQTLWTQA